MLIFLFCWPFIYILSHSFLVSLLCSVPQEIRNGKNSPGSPANCLTANFNELEALMQDWKRKRTMKHMVLLPSSLYVKEYLCLYEFSTTAQPVPSSYLSMLTAGLLFCFCLHFLYWSIADGHQFAFTIPYLLH
jgi:hypothetical protein